jgi:hypothetical protein
MQDNEPSFKLSVQLFETSYRPERSRSTCIMQVQSIVTCMASHASRLSKYQLADFCLSEISYWFMAPPHETLRYRMPPTAGATQ